MITKRYQGEGRTFSYWVGCRGGGGHIKLNLANIFLIILITFLTSYMGSASNSAFKPRSHVARNAIAIGL